MIPNLDFSGFLAVSGLFHDRLIYPRKQWHSRIKALLSARSGISADGPAVEIPNFGFGILAGSDNVRHENTGA